MLCKICAFLAGVVQKISDFINEVQEFLSWVQENLNFQFFGFKKIFLVEGLSFLHGKNIAHLDIKDPNILYSHDVDMPVFQIADFGLATTMTNVWERAYVRGTFGYMASEILKKNYIFLMPMCLVWELIFTTLRPNRF